MGSAYRSRFVLILLSFAVLASAVPRTAQAADNDCGTGADGAGTAASARQIAAGKCAGRLSPSDAVDWYRIPADGGQALKASLTGESTLFELCVVAPSGAQSCRMSDGTQVSVRATVEGDWFAQVKRRETSGGAYQLSITITPNGVPAKPPKPAGPSKAGTDTVVEFCTKASDPEGDRVRYTFVWGDGPITTSEYVNSGTQACAKHQYASKASYPMYTYATDAHQAFGPRSDFAYINTEGECRTGRLDAPSTKETAATIEGRSSCDAALSPGGDQDWFATPLASGETLYVSLGPADRNATFRLCISVPSGLERCDAKANAKTLSLRTSTAGQAIIGVTSPSGSTTTGSYMLTLNRTSSLPPSTPSAPSGPAVAGRNQTVTFCTTATDPDRDRIRYQFEWGDGEANETLLVQSGTEGCLSHSFRGSGVFGVRARAMDDHGVPSAYTKYVDVRVGSAPSASVPAGPGSGDQGQTLQYCVVASDPEGDRVQAEFDWNDGTFPSTTDLGDSGSQRCAVHRYSAPGRYSIKARGIDASGSAGAYGPILLVSIAGAPSAASLPSGPSSTDTISSVRYCSIAHDPNEDQIRYVFSWGDGAPPTTTVLLPSGAQGCADHTFTSPGAFNVTAQAIDAGGSAGTASDPRRVQVSVAMATLSVGVSETGRVVSSPSGIDCPGSCIAKFPVGARVTLSAAPGDGFAFLRWDGACAGQAATCSIDVQSSTATTAEFERAQCAPQQASIGSWKVSGCLASTSGVYRAWSPISFAGLTVAPSAGATLTIDPSAQRLSTSGRMSIVADLAGAGPIPRVGPITLYDGTAAISLQASIAIPVPEASQMLGFSFGGSSAVLTPTTDGASIAASIKLPDVLGRGTAVASFATSLSGGLKVDSIRVVADSVGVAGLLKATGVLFTYAAKEGWTGSADIASPGLSGRVSLAFSYVGGKLDKAAIRADELSIAGIGKARSLDITFTGDRWSLTAELGETGATQVIGELTFSAVGSVATGSLRADRLPLFGFAEAKVFTLSYAAASGSWNVHASLSGQVSGTVTGSLSYSGGLISSARLVASGIDVAGVFALQTLTLDYQASGSQVLWTGSAVSAEGMSLNASFSLDQGTLTSAVVHADELSLFGAVQLNGFRFEYAKAKGLWDLKGTVRVRGGSPTAVDAGLRFVGGSLERGWLRVENLVIARAIDVRLLSIKYVASGLWSGEVDVLLPGPATKSLKGEIELQNRTIKKLTVSVAGVNVAVGPGVFLNGASLSYVAQPPKLAGSLKLSAGPTVAGTSALGIDAQGAIEFGSGTQPSVYRIQGTASLAGRELGSATVVYSGGVLSFKGNLGVTVGRASLSGTVEGTITPTAFTATGAGSVAVGGVGVSGEILVSDAGLAACGMFPPFGWRAGFGYRWGETLPTIAGGSCDINPWRTIRTATTPIGETEAEQQAAPVGITKARVFIPGGSGVQAMEFVGITDEPSVRFTRPDGTSFVATPQDPGKKPDHVVMADAESTFVLLDNPSPGTWTVEAADETSTIGSIRRASGGAIVASGEIADGSGPTKMLSWLVSTDEDQEVVFSEVGAGASRVILRTRQEAGSVSFIPDPGEAGERTVVADVYRGGALRASIPLDVFIVDEAVRLTVRTVGAGSGTVTLEPGGVVCTPLCSVSLTRGSNAVLRARTSSGSEFVGWSSGCAALDVCSLSVVDAGTIDAIFAPDSAVARVSDPGPFEAAKPGVAGGHRPVIVENAGASSMTIHAVTTSPPSEFSRTADDCTARTLVPGDSCVVEVAFTPSGPGERTGEVVVATSSGESRVGLRGEGVLPVLGFTPGRLTFAEGRVGIDSETQVLHVSNEGIVPASIGVVGFGGDNASDFSAPLDLCSSRTLDPGASCMVFVRFAPAGPGPQRAELSIASDAGPAPAAVPLSGTGLDGSASIELSRTNVAFSGTYVGVAAPLEEIRVTSRASSPMTIKSVNIVRGASEFGIVHDGCSGTDLPSGQACGITVSFNPDEAGFREGLLSLIANDGVAEHSIVFSGEGLPDETKPSTVVMAQTVYRTEISGTTTDTLSGVGVVTATVAGPASLFVFAAEATLQCNGLRTSCDWRVVLPPITELPPGVYVITVAATDRAGNRETDRQLIGLRA